VSQSLATQRFQMSLMVLLAAAGVFLAGLGIYGVVSQGVAQRIAEFGLRIALGAHPGSIHALVLRRALFPVAAGFAVGVIASMAVGRVMETLLFGVSPTDILPVLAAGVFLIGVSALASIVPAYRATRVHPVKALRNE
jgi:ABC-type antimicrobial peptide transport system permease subunit